MVLAGIDLGGTKIGVSLGDRDGRVLQQDRFDTDQSRTPTDLLQESVERLRRLCVAQGLAGSADLAELEAVGMACPGPLDYEAGCLLEVPNVPGWQRFPLRTWLAEHLAPPSTFMNDANAGVLAEVLWGAAQGTRSAVFLTMSTGMGAGLYLDGRVYEGPRALAGEIGHVRLREDGPVGFGKRGSVEGYLSGPGMIQVAEAELLRFVHAGLATKLAEGELTPVRICQLASEGDLAGLAVVDRCGHELGRLCAMLVDILDPEVIVLGTIGSAWFELWEPRAMRVIEAEAIEGAADRVVIRPSGLPSRGDQQALAIARRLLEGA